MFETVEVPKTKPLVSVIPTLLPLTIDTAPVKLLAAFKVTLFAAPAVTDVVPPIVRTPGALTRPLATMVRLPACVVIALFNVTVVPAFSATLRLFPAPEAVMFALKIMLPTAFKVSVAAVPPVIVTALVIVMLPVCVPAPLVLIITLVPAVRLALIVVAFTVALSAEGLNVFGFPPLKVPFAVTVVIKTSDGSKSHVPALPSADDASTFPKA